MNDRVRESRENLRTALSVEEICDCDKDFCLHTERILVDAYALIA